MAALIEAKMAIQRAVLPVLGLLLAACDPATHAGGVVRDAAGAPIPDATVSLAVGEDARVERGRTDSAGRFAVTRFGGRAGPVQLRVCRDGYQIATREWAEGDAYSLIVILEPVRTPGARVQAGPDHPVTRC